MKNEHHKQDFHGVLGGQPCREAAARGTGQELPNVLAQSMVSASDAFVHPFDDPLVRQGHSTMVDEIVRAGVRPGVIVLSVGGGGVLCGVVQGLHRHGWTEVPVVAVEPVGADSLAQSVAAGPDAQAPPRDGPLPRLA